MSTLSIGRLLIFAIHSVFVNLYPAVSTIMIVILGVTINSTIYEKLLLCTKMVLEHLISFSELENITVQCIEYAYSRT